MKRFAIFSYGLLSYVLCLGVFVYAIGFVGGFGTPTHLDAAPDRPLGVALAIDLALLAAFAVQHSGMARGGFKRWWTRIIPASAERSTYVLFSSLAMVALFALWEPIGGVIWQAESAWARNSLIALNLGGWALLVYVTFLIDHFDLFGLAQVWRQLRGAPHADPHFRTPSLYRVVRHPLYVGWLVIFWAAPVMTVAHLVFAVMTTAYILIAVRLEERDLLASHGPEYAAWRARTPMLVPRLRAPRRESSLATRIVLTGATLALALGALHPAAVSAAERGDVLSRTVRFDLHDLDTPELARHLYLRLQTAAVEVCRPHDGTALSRKLRYGECLRVTLERGVAALARLSSP